MKTDTDTTRYPLIDTEQRRRVVKISVKYRLAGPFSTDPLVPSYQDMEGSAAVLAEIAEKVKQLSDCIYYIYNNPDVPIETCMNIHFYNLPVNVTSVGKRFTRYTNEYITVTEEH